MKKTFAFILVLAMMLSAVSGAYAQLVSERYVNAPDYYTSEYQAELALTKERAEQYVAQPSMLRSGMAGSLAVPLYKQETTFYCGPASIQMTLKYANGTKYSQSSIATDTGMDYCQYSGHLKVLLVQLFCLNTASFSLGVSILLAEWGLLEL
ncbi:MAG: hypothetical protein GX025_04280 [Clostridiales bacterium]|nr:hypothetical protein [Clostridiales bacterium]